VTRRSRQRRPAESPPARRRWALDAGLLVLIWRLAIAPMSSWWRDPPAILAGFWIALVLAQPRAADAPGRVTRIAMYAAMAWLFALFLSRQLPLTLRVLGFGA
jgi:hypothetical protein